MSAFRLFVDIQTVQSSHHADRGIPRFATELSRALLATGAPVAAFALNPLRPFPRRLHPELAHAPELAWNTATAFRRAHAAGPLRYLVLSPFEDVRPVDDARASDGVLAPHVTGTPRVVIVYDLIPEVFGYLPTDARARPYERRRAWIRDAELIVTLSRHTRHDIIERWGIESERVAVIGAAATPFFCPALPADGDPAAAAGAGVPAIRRPFVLSVTGRLSHKNPETLIDAWARVDRQVREAHQLIVACTLPGDSREQLAERIEALGLTTDDVVLTGFVPDEVLRNLYRASTLVVLPSHYEGFGLPILEAAACGALAISSNASSLPEILEWPEATFPPGNADAMATLIERGVTDSAFRTQLGGVCRDATRRYTWDHTVQHLLAACSELAEPRVRLRRPRLALVGPFASSGSGRGCANEEVAQRLAARCELDCFVDDGAVSTAAPRSQGPNRRFPARSLGVVFSPATYDAVVYTVGSGSESVQTRRLAAQYPGVALSDDVPGADLIPNAWARVVESDPERAAARILDLIADDDRPSVRPVEAPPRRAAVPG